MPASKFCEGRDFEPQALYRARSRLWPKSDSRVPGPKPEPGIAIAQVVRAVQARPVAASQTVAIEVGGTRVVMSLGAESSALRMVLEALGHGVGR